MPREPTRTDSETGKKVAVTLELRTDADLALLDSHEWWDLALNVIPRDFKVKVLRAKAINIK
ncbi:MAG: hypothetical protein GY937_20025 [bacterium]|nr:hypothetical protein [bacterium]